MKYDAIVDQGIPIHERVPIPEWLIPEDSRVEIDAKISAGYFTNEKIPSIEDLEKLHGRAWYVHLPVTHSSLEPRSEQQDMLRAKSASSHSPRLSCRSSLS